MQHLIVAVSFLIAAIVLLVVLILNGCAECRVNEFRCSSTVLEVCDDDERWKTSESCGDIVDEWGRVWTCCDDYLDAGAECTPLEECSSVDGGVR